MAVTGTRVTAGTAPTTLLTGPTPGEGVKGTVGLLRVPSGGAALYLGASNVTTATGFELLAGESVSIDVDPGETLYGCVATGTQAVHILGATSND